jgi:cardiolipin synthase A/B
MKIQILVDFDAFWASLSRDILAAEQEAFVETFSFEGDRIGKMLGGLLVDSHARDKRILVDSFSKVMLSDRFRYAPRNWFNSQLRLEARETEALHATLPLSGVKVKYGKPFGHTPRSFFTRNHKKLIVVDDRVVYIGGINFSEHNASWHDMMLRIDDGAIARFLRDDFLASWKGKSAGAIKQFERVALFALNGRANASAFADVLKLIDSAKSSIFIESPYITFPFYDRLRDASHRGVRVTIVTPGANNWSLFADYARWESARCGIDLRFFRKGMSHLKAMLIDDRYLVAGSSNFDFLSYRIYQEIVAIITAPEVIAEFKETILNIDLANSDQVEEQAARNRPGWSQLRRRLLNKGLTVLLD